MNAMKNLLTIVFLAATMAAFATGKGELHGNVIDVNGEEVAGAKVTVKGTDIVTYTDFDGAFHIEGLENGKYELEISFLGHEEVQTKKIEVSDNFVKQVKYQLSAR
jgi:hypothetical protein